MDGERPQTIWRRIGAYYACAVGEQRWPAAQVGTGLKVRSAGNNWWLRSPGNNDGNAAFVVGDGVVFDSGAPVDHEFGVRPALQLNLESVIFKSDQ